MIMLVALKSWILLRLKEQMEVAIDTVIAIMLTIVIVAMTTESSFKPNHTIYSHKQIARYKIINKLYYKAMITTIVSIRRKSKKDFIKEVCIHLKA